MRRLLIAVVTAVGALLITAAPASARAVQPDASGYPACVHFRSLNYSYCVPLSLIPDL